MEAFERPLQTAGAEVRRVRSRGQMIGAAVMIGVGLVGLVVSLAQYDAIVALSSTYEGRRDGLRGLVAPGLVFFSGAAVVGGLLWLTLWAYRWERTASGAKLVQRASSYLSLPPQEANALLERIGTGDPRVYLPLPLSKSGHVLFAVWTVPDDAIAYVGLTVRQGNGWHPLPLVTLRDNAYAAVKDLRVDHYGMRASQTVVNGFLDPFLRN